MSEQDERAFFAQALKITEEAVMEQTARMNERVSKEALTLLADPQRIREGCTAQMWAAHLMALELTERRERERKFIESFETIRQDASCSAYIGTICDEALLPEPPDA